MEARVAGSRKRWSIRVGIPYCGATRRRRDAEMRGAEEIVRRSRLRFASDPFLRTGTLKLISRPTRLFRESFRYVSNWAE